jgi:AbrB family looped-hinge helix DNA binding protein
MELEISKLTSKYQATIPGGVRKLLKLGKGDTVIFRREGGRVVLDKARPQDAAWASLAQSSLTEWNSPDDDEAFADL